MHDVFVARQPIFDRDLNIFGYELLSRRANTAAAPVLDGDTATAEVILNTFTAIGFEELVGEHYAFLNMTRRFLLQQQPPLILPASRVVLEVLEDTLPDAELINALRGWAERGYTIALDDFIVRDSTLPLLDVAHIVKVEVNALTEAELKEQVQALRRYRPRLLAEKVETREQFELCRRLGFDYFQGFFLERPQVMQGTSISTARLPVVMLLAALYRPEVDVEELEEIISRDVSLSYKLLRYLNSPLFPVRRPIDSIYQAVVYLGMEELRVWASLVILSAVPNAPRALVVMLMVRAKMCELLARGLGHAEPRRCFTVGLFSGLDALLDVPLPQLLDRIALGEEMTAALLRRQGDSGRILECVLRYEQADWDHIVRLGVAPQVAVSAYLDAVRWANQAPFQT